MLRLLRALSACALVAACAPQPVARRSRTPVPVHAPPCAPAVLALHFDERRAPWFRGQDVDAEKTATVSPDKLVQENVGVDIVSLGGRFYAYDEEHGASGPFAPPGGAEWLGIDATGAVWAARRDGAILRSRDVVAALHAHAYERIATEPGIRDFDVNGMHAVAAAGSDLVLIDTRDNRVRRIRRPGALSLDRARVRSDGVVIAAGRNDNWRVVLLGSRGRGAWRVESLWGAPERAGDFVMAGGVCFTLARDGVGWFDSVNATEPDVLHRFWVHQRVVAYGPEPSFRRLADLPAHGRREPPDSCGGSHRTRAPRVKIGHEETWVASCAGAARVMGAIHPAKDDARYHFGLLADGTCNLSDDWECSSTDPLTRRPHAAVLDRDANRLQIAVLPDGCHAVRMLSAAGAGMLLCRSEDGIRIETLDPSGRWHREADLAGADPRALTLETARDGTMLLRSKWLDLAKRRAWVRRPLALGRAGAWRRLDVSDLIELRAVPGGNVLGIKLESAAPVPETFSIVLVSAARRRMLAHRVTIVGALDDFDLVGSTVALWVSTDWHGGQCGCVHPPPPDARILAVTKAGTLRECARIDGGHCATR